MLTCPPIVLHGSVQSSIQSNGGHFLSHLTDIDARGAAVPATQQTPEGLAILLFRSGQGDRTAFAELYQCSNRKLFGIVLGVLQDDVLANEILQEVYVRIWNNAAGFEAERASAITWMAVIARNRAVDERRKHRNDPLEPDNEAQDRQASAQSGPASLMQQSEDLTRLQTCLDGVGEPQSSMVRQAYLEGVSREELAAHYDKPVGTIKTWLHRSLKQLKLCLGGS